VIENNALPEGTLQAAIDEATHMSNTANQKYPPAATVMAGSISQLVGPE
jgi:hypothetical protein